jgi:aryl-alcohol dehydrogenase-like predicted oxidoreductase
VWPVVDILRIEVGRLAEHWDVMQDEVTRGAALATLRTPLDVGVNFVDTADSYSFW